MTTDHRSLAVTTFNRCWELLDAGVTSVEEKEELLTNAFASKYHWQIAGGLQQHIISDWMVARAAGAAGYGELAIRFAQRSYDAVTPELPDWLAASGAEGLARAWADAGQLAVSAQWRETAEALIAKIEGDQDRALIASQLATVPR